MGENKRLFPIGVLAKLTGVHIRSLRYYEELGILRPAHVDEKTGYRYYTYRQMRVVEAIQYCVELDIPLKKFAEFISQEYGLIDYEGLAAYGKIVTEEKIRTILQRQTLLEEMNKGMEHARKCTKQEKMTDYFSEEHYYCIAYDGPQNGGSFQTTMVKLIRELEAEGFMASYDNGIMTCVIDGKKKSYCFVNIKDSDKDISKYPQIITVPAGEYICTATAESGKAEEIFSQELSEGKDVYIIETELFTSKFPYTNPTFELRCHVEDKECDKES